MLLPIQPKIVLAGVLHQTVHRRGPIDELVFPVVDVRRRAAIHVLARRRFSRPLSAEPAGENPLAEQDVSRLASVGGGVAGPSARGADDPPVYRRGFRTPVKEALGRSSAPDAVVSAGPRFVADEGVVLVAGVHRFGPECGASVWQLDGAVV